MTTIDTNSHVCTLINIFMVEPGKQQELFDLLKEATEQVMCKLPGYISANLHLSDDKKTVANYAQWATIDDFKNMMQNSEAQAHMKKAALLATEVRPVTYKQIWSDAI
jgi:heme-degrading monooxygenase HmoA